MNGFKIETPGTLPSFNAGRSSRRDVSGSWAQRTLVVSIAWGLAVLGMVVFGGLGWGHGTLEDSVMERVADAILLLQLVPWVPPALGMCLLRFGPRNSTSVPGLALAVVFAGYLALAALWAALVTLGMPIRNLVTFLVYNYAPYPVLLALWFVQWIQASDDLKPVSGAPVPSAPPVPSFVAVPLDSWSGEIPMSLESQAVTAELETNVPPVAPKSATGTPHGRHKPSRPRLTRAVRSGPPGIRPQSLERERGPYIRRLIAGWVVVTGWAIMDNRSLTHFSVDAFVIAAIYLVVMGLVMVSAYGVRVSEQGVKAITHRGPLMIRWPEVTYAVMISKVPLPEDDEDPEDVRFFVLLRLARPFMPAPTFWSPLTLRVDSAHDSIRISLESFRHPQALLADIDTLIPQSAQVYTPDGFTKAMPDE